MAKYTSNPAVQIDELGNPHLKIFLHFFFEKSLPKYQKPSDAKKTPEESDMDSIMVDASNNMNVEPSRTRSKITSSDWGYRQSVTRSIMNQAKDKKRFKWARSICNRIHDKFSNSTPVEEIFDEAKKSMRFPTTPDLEKARDDAKKLGEFLRASGQLNQAQKVDDYSEILAGELILAQNGITKYLTEQDILEFMLKSEKGLYIDFLRNFSNILPLEVAKTKINIDKLLVFDNYSVLYYDPTVDPFRKIAHIEAKRKAADPILFGMISGSDKLYYITDWVYKDDDITMEKVEQVLGRKANNLKQAEIAESNYKIQQILDGLISDVEAIL